MSHKSNIYMQIQGRLQVIFSLKIPKINISPIEQGLMLIRTFGVDIVISVHLVGYLIWSFCMPSSVSSALSITARLQSSVFGALMDRSDFINHRHLKYLYSCQDFEIRPSSNVNRPPRNGRIPSREYLKFFGST